MNNLFKLTLFSFLILTSSLLKASGESDSIIAKHSPDTVKIGCYLISLHDINFHDKEYTARFWLWMLHKNPDFNFVKQVEVPNAKSMEQPDIITDIVNGSVYELMKMKCIMKQSWEVEDYPFDKQDLNIRIENTVYDDGSLVFKADTLDSNFDPKITVDGWDIKDFKVSTGISPYSTAFGFPSQNHYSEYSCFKISMRLERNAWGLFFKIFLGMYIAFFISLITFIISPEEVEPRFGLPVGGLFAAVGNKYIIDSILPESSNFTLVDSLHAITFLFILFTIAVAAISLIFYNKGNLKKAEKFNKKGAIVVTGLYFLINIVLIIIAIIH